MNSLNRNLKILYIGPNDETRKGFRALLQSAGYEVEAAAPPSKGGQGLEARGFHFVVSTEPVVDSSEAGSTKPSSKAQRKGRSEQSAVAMLARLRPIQYMADKTDKTDKTGKIASRGATPTSRGASAQHATMSLRALRRTVGKTQRAIAGAAAMSQPQLSRFEARGDHLISTLRTYVRALGGDIEVVARIGGRRITLRDL